MNVALAEPDIITDLEFDLEIPCEGRAHASGTNAHVIDQPASYALISPCCGLRVVLCRGRAKYLELQADTIHCRLCGRDSTADKWGFKKFGK